MFTDGKLAGNKKPAEAGSLLFDVRLVLDVYADHRASHSASGRIDINLITGRKRDPAPL